MAKENTMGKKHPHNVRVHNGQGDHCVAQCIEASFSVCSKDPETHNFPHRHFSDLVNDKPSFWINSKGKRQWYACNPKSFQ